MAQPTYYCAKCRRSKNVTNFYRSNNTEKYKDGILIPCKDCLTIHVDNWDSRTFTWILEECDVPYVPDVWYDLLRKHGKNGQKITGSSILGRYLAVMKLKQYRDYRWKDSDFLRELNKKKKEEDMLHQGYSRRDVEKILANDEEMPQDVKELQEVETPQEKIESIFASKTEPTYLQGAVPPPQQVIASSDNSSSLGLPSMAQPPGWIGQDPQDEVDYFDLHQNDDISMHLTPEDRTKLCLKWGKTYKPEEWVRLEQFYEEMMQSYDIQGAGHLDTLKLVCKTSLKANQLIDIGDKPLMSP